MDFIGKLPREISLHILSFLPPNALVKCFLVSKTWYNLTNTDFLWRRHCLVRKINKTDSDKAQNRPSSLCGWATAYRTFIRKINRWENDRAQYFDINLTSGSCVLAFGSFSVAVYYFSTVDSTLEQLYFYQICEEDVKCEEMIDLELPGRGIVQLITNDVYTLVSRDNFILCLKKIADKHVSYAAICLRGGILEHSSDDLMNFINSKRFISRELSIRELCGCYLWLEDSTSFHIFNLENHTCTRIEALQALKVMSNLFAVWSSNTVFIYSPNGEVIQSILVDLVQDICLNKNILAILQAYTDHHSRVLQTFDIRTGKKLMEKTVMRFTDITLHSDYDYVYALERSSRDLYRVSSLCARSGQTQWSISQPNMFYNMWPATVQVVSYKHLFVWPSNNRTDKYSVFNCKTGKHLYVSSKVLGNIQSISEGLCVSIDGSVLHIKSFL